MAGSALAVGGGIERVLEGGCWSERLLGEALPAVGLLANDGSVVDLVGSSRAPVVVFVFPGVDRGVGSPRDPDGLLGSGCTVQSRGFRDLSLDFGARGIKILGISSCELSEQRTFAARERLDFPLLCDPELLLHRSLGLPVYETPSGESVYQRMSFLAHEGIVQRVFHPIPIPRRNAADILTHINHHQADR